jgi:hypothetical protein
MPPVAKKTSAAPAQALAAPVKNTAIVKAATAAKVVPPAKNAALAAVAAAMAATAAGAAPQKVSSSDQVENEDAQAPRRWIVKKTLNKFKANLRSVPDYYLPKFIQLVAAEVAPRCDGDQPLSRCETVPVCNCICYELSACWSASLSCRAGISSTLE